ncbi:hypothetical protein PRZ48_005346 [Zasmidium cellare]|uniref:Uncharacterized protein n=1 Tax=Zasmidium cellare TaxID=395010 RepID=A0ABR0ET50_ZASCE|nr:hypothetical protein PRZ48_005346 [Zasmidium cellare]
MSPPVNRTSVPATINYYLDPSLGGGETLSKLEPHEMQIHDIRGSEGDFTLDTHGFQVVQHGVRVDPEDFADDGRRENLYAETAGIVKKATGASRVMPISHLHRQQSHVDSVAAKSVSPDSMKTIGPAMVAHVDQSYQGAVALLNDKLASEAEKASRTRWAIVNVWIPLHFPVPREPLAVCDARSVDEQDLVEQALVFRGAFKSAFKGVSQGSGCGMWKVRYNSKHQWYYKSHLGTQEAILLKIFDSKLDGRARRCPHSAFKLPNQDEKAPARESVETRCLVFWDDQSAE